MCVLHTSDESVFRLSQDWEFEVWIQEDDLDLFTLMCQKLFLEYFVSFDLGYEWVVAKCEDLKTHVKSRRKWWLVFVAKGHWFCKFTRKKLCNESLLS